MKHICETERLYLREFTIEDSIHFYRMNLDQEVIKYTGDAAFNSETEAKLFLINYNQYKLHKMGRWAVCEKQTNEFLGWCGLKYHPNDDLVEVGYRFYKKHWNKGYATESALASINYGFDVLKLKEIYAHAHIDNFASHKVIEKCGLKFIDQANYDGMPAKLYKIKNPYITIKQIPSTKTYLVRQLVLRVEKPIEDCEFDGDDLETTFHLGLYLKNELIGVATFLENKNKLFNHQKQIQLRGMAILKKEQGFGFGDLLLKKGETILKEKGTELLWFNAREKAIGFYKKNSYEILGKSFNIPHIGLHYTMYKHLNQ